MNISDRQTVIHCLKAMIDEELCEECPLYGTTGTDHCEEDCVRLAIKALEQEPKHCTECKWWKDKDGVYRRGISAESKCPINRREVMEGRGYCFLFAPQESEDK